MNSLTFLTALHILTWLVYALFILTVFAFIIYVLFLAWQAHIEGLYSNEGVSDQIRYAVKEGGEL